MLEQHSSHKVKRRMDALTFLVMHERAKFKNVLLAPSDYLYVYVNECAISMKDEILN